MPEPRSLSVARSTEWSYFTSFNYHTAKVKYFCTEIEPNGRMTNRGIGQHRAYSTPTNYSQKSYRWFPSHYFSIFRRLTVKNVQNASRYRRTARDCRSWCCTSAECHFWSTQFVKCKFTLFTLEQPLIVYPSFVTSVKTLLLDHRRLKCTKTNVPLIVTTCFYWVLSHNNSKTI